MNSDFGGNDNEPRDHFEEWEQQIDEMDIANAGISKVEEYTLGEARSMLNVIYQLDDTEQVCNFVIIAHIHPKDKHYMPHRGLMITSLDDDEIPDFVRKAIEGMDDER